VIALDTNVLLRLFVADDATQAATARRVASEVAGRGETMFINTVVLAELAWVLRSRHGRSRNDVTQVVGSLLDDDLFTVEDRVDVAAALSDSESLGGDFADCLIARRNLAAGCETTLTFDKLAQRHPGFRAP